MIFQAKIERDSPLMLQNEGETTSGIALILTTSLVLLCEQIILPRTSLITIKMCYPKMKHNSVVNKAAHRDCNYDPTSINRYRITFQSIKSDTKLLRSALTDRYKTQMPLAALRQRRQQSELNRTRPVDQRTTHWNGSIKQIHSENSDPLER